MNQFEFDEFVRAQTRVLTPQQVAVLLGKSERVLRLWRAKKIGPPWYRVGPKLIKYEEPSVLAWRDQQRNLQVHVHCPTCGGRVMRVSDGKLTGGGHEVR